nr:unnamed protein product [Callosobruchus analis]
MSDVVVQENDEKVDRSRKKLSRIRQRNPEQWKCNIRKESFDRGREYISVRKKRVPARMIRTSKDCVSKCIYQCARKISETQREDISSHYYMLTAQEKKMFILNTTIMTNPERRRKGKNKENSRKSNTFNYFFNVNSNRIQICKLFYCGTLSISQKPIYTAHKHKTSSNTPQCSTQGKHKKKFTSEESINLVKEHINMFPRISSHYCRATSKREYLEADLSIKKCMSCI